jgi:hypothetical protein
VQDKKNPSVWVAEIDVHGRPQFLGKFPTEDDAGQASMRAVEELRSSGSLQRLLGNFPNQLDGRVPAPPQRPVRKQRGRKTDEDDEEYTGSESEDGDGSNSSESEEEDSDDSRKPKRRARAAPRRNPPQSRGGHYGGIPNQGMHMPHMGGHSYPPPMYGQHGGHGHHGGHGQSSAMGFLNNQHGHGGPYRQQMGMPGQHQHQHQHAGYGQQEQAHAGYGHSGYGQQMPPAAGYRAPPPAYQHPHHQQQHQHPSMAHNLGLNVLGQMAAARSGPPQHQHQHQQHHAPQQHMAQTLHMGAGMGMGVSYPPAVNMAPTGMAQHQPQHQHQHAHQPGYPSADSSAARQAASGLSMLTAASKHGGPVVDEFGVVPDDQLPQYGMPPTMPFPHGRMGTGQGDDGEHAIVPTLMRGHGPSENFMWLLQMERGLGAEGGEGSGDESRRRMASSTPKGEEGGGRGSKGRPLVVRPLKRS